MGKQFTRTHIFKEQDDVPLKKSAWLLKHLLDLSRPKHPDMDLIIDHKKDPVTGILRSDLQLLIAKRGPDDVSGDLYYVVDKKTLPQLCKQGIVDDQGYKHARDALNKLDVWRGHFSEAYRDFILSKLILDEVKHIASYDHAIYSIYPMKPDIEGDFSVYECTQLNETNAGWYLSMTQPRSFSGFGDASAIMERGRRHKSSYGPFRPVSDNEDIRSLIPNGFYKREP